MAAQVSGPGALSKRTDTGGQPIRSLPNPDYGEQTAYREQQKSAPLAASADEGPRTPYPSDIAAMGGTPSELPTTPNMGEAPLPSLWDAGDPQIPITSGAPIGPGLNSLPTERAAQPYSLSQELAQYAAGGGEGLGWLANQIAEMGY